MPCENLAKPDLRPAGLVLVLAAVTLGFADTAGATLVTMRPDGDRTPGWRAIKASEEWRAVDDPVAAGGSLGTGDRMAAMRRHRTATITVSDPAVAAGEIPTGFSGHYYARTGRRTRLRAVLRIDGEARASERLGPRSRGAWRRIDVPARGSEDADTAKMAFGGEDADTAKMAFRVLRGKKARVDVAYVDVTTAPSGSETPPPSPEPDPPRGNVSVHSSTAVIRPEQGTPAGGSDTARIAASRNEFESFQVVVEAPSEALEDVTIAQAGDLSGPGGATIPSSNLTIYREAYYEVSAAEGRPRSSRQGAEGQWPDALIPERDPYYGEDRAAFPVDVAAGSKVTAWIDVFVPKGAPPGEYTGSLKVSSGGGELATVPVSLRVANVELPSTSTLRTAFLVTPPGYFPCKAHRPVDWCYQEEQESWELDYLYARAALENRVTIPNAVPGGFGQSPDPPAFTRFILPLIQGTDSGGIAGTQAPRLRGARLTSVVAMWQCIIDDGCLADWRALAQQHGFVDRFIAYVCDEPFDHDTPEYWNDWRDCDRNSRTAERDFPGVKTLVTATIQSARQAETAGKIDVSSRIDNLTVPVNRMANRPDNPQAGNQRPAYDGFLADTSDGANEVWMYTACPQFSCDEQEASYFDDWPAYVIDQPATHSRAMGWMSFLYDASGELYHNTVLALDSAWNDQYRFGGNGDGTLFYPGTPSGFRGTPAIGGSHDIPIESIRLKRIRDGREDYELMHALEERGQADVARNAVTTLLGPLDTAMFSANVGQTQVGTMRCTLMTELDPALATPCSV